MVQGELVQCASKKLTQEGYGESEYRSRRLPHAKRALYQ